MLVLKKTPLKATYQILLAVGLCWGLSYPACSAELHEVDFVVVGSSAVGQGAIKALEKADAESKILWISKDVVDPYNKVFLSDYLVSSKIKDLKVKSVNPKIKKKFGYRVVSIDHKNNSLEIASKNGNEIVKYKKLLLGVGLESKALSLAGEASAQHFSNIFTYYSLENVNAIHQYMKIHKTQRAAVVGTGPNALEFATALNKLGLHVTIIGRSKDLISKMLEPKESDYLKSLIIQKYSNDVTYIVHPEKLKIIEADRGVTKVATGIQLPQEKYVPVDIIVHAIGTEPNTRFLQKSGIDLDEAGYIKTNGYLQTNIPDIYSAGDSTLVFNRLWNQPRPSVKWMDAFEQGECAAENMLKADSCKYEGIAPMVTTKVFDVKLAMTDKDPQMQLTDKQVLEDLNYLRVSLNKDSILKSFVSINGGMFQVLKLRNTLLKGEKTSFEQLLDNRGWGINFFMQLDPRQKKAEKP